MPISADITKEPWYAIHNIDNVDTPALVVYLDRVEQNMERAKKIVGDLQRLRPHIKTHKSREAALLMLNACLKKFKCATIAEAEILASLQAPDVLLAYQPVGPKVLRLLSLIKNYPDTNFSCLVDNAQVAQQLSQMAGQAQTTIHVFVDVNVGMNRTGVLPSDALALYEFCAELPNIKIVGLHVYDGHITDTDFETRQQRCNVAFEPIEQLRDDLIKKGFDAPVIVAGGSATFSIHAARKDVECSPGTFIYWDAGYQQLLPELPFQPAALVVTRIISLPNSKTICADLGHKAIASENVLSKRVVFLNAPELKPVAHSEEHLVLEAPESHEY